MSLFCFVVVLLLLLLCCLFFFPVQLILMENHLEITFWLFLNDIADKNYINFPERRRKIKYKMDYFLKSLSQKKANSLT